MDLDLIRHNSLYSAFGFWNVTMSFNDRFMPALSLSTLDETMVTVNRQGDVKEDSMPENLVGTRRVR